MILKLKDFNMFDKKNELNSVVTSQGSLNLFRLFMPIFVELLLRNLMNTVSVYIVGRVSDDAVAAIGVASQLLNIFVMLYVVIGAGATVVINQNLGAGRDKRAGDTATSTVYLCGLMAVIIGIITILFAKPLIGLMQLEERLIPDAELYLKITVGCSIFNAVMTAATSISRAYGNTFYPVIVSLLMNVINAVLSYIIVFRPFETPLSGVAGIAVARVLAELISCAIMLTLLKKVKHNIKLINTRAFSKQIFCDILTIGLPRGVQTISYSFTQAITTAILAGLGATAVSAKIYVTNIVFYSYLLGSALGQSNGLMVGRLIGNGENDRAYRMTLRNLVIAMSLNTLFAVVLAFLRFPLLKIFTSDPEILAVGATVMIVDVVVELGRAMNQIFEDSLAATGDVKFPTIAILGTSWGLSVLFSYILGVRLGMGLMGCWIAYGMDELTRGILYLYRWKNGAWRNKSLVKQDNVQIN